MTEAETAAAAGAGARQAHTCWHGHGIRPPRQPTLVAEMCRLPSASHTFWSLPVYTCTAGWQRRSQVGSTAQPGSHLQKVCRAWAVAVLPVACRRGKSLPAAGWYPGCPAGILSPAATCWRPGRRRRQTRPTREPRSHRGLGRAPTWRAAAAQAAAAARWVGGKQVAGTAAAETSRERAAAARWGQEERAVGAKRVRERAVAARRTQERGVAARWGQVERAVGAKPAQERAALKQVAGRRVLEPVPVPVPGWVQV